VIMANIDSVIEEEIHKYELKALVFLLMLINHGKKTFFGSIRDVNLKMNQLNTIFNYSFFKNLF
jgi:hypothetical protein